MVGVGTAAATETLRRARARVDMTAGRASLRAEGSGHFDQLPSLPGELVAKHLDQAAPACIQNSPGKPGADLDHVSYLEALDDHRAVTLGVGARERMQSVLALPADLAMQPACGASIFGRPATAPCLAEEPRSTSSKTLHPSTARRGFLPDLKDGVSAPENR